jgi:hypothetical protein
MRNTNRGADLAPVPFRPVAATPLPEVIELEGPEGWIRWDAAVAWRDSQRGDLDDPFAAVTVRSELDEPLQRDFEASGFDSVVPQRGGVA